MLLGARPPDARHSHGNGTRLRRHDSRSGGSAEPVIAVPGAFDRRSVPASAAVIASASPLVGSRLAITMRNQLGWNVISKHHSVHVDNQIDAIYTELRFAPSASTFHVPARSTALCPACTESRTCVAPTSALGSRRTKTGTTTRPADVLERARNGDLGAFEDEESWWSCTFEEVENLAPDRTTACPCPTSPMSRWRTALTVKPYQGSAGWLSDHWRKHCPGKMVMTPTVDGNGAGLSIIIEYLCLYQT
jgi:hypothetical protein